MHRVFGRYIIQRHITIFNCSLHVCVCVSWCNSDIENSNLTFRRENWMKINQKSHYIIKTHSFIMQHLACIAYTMQHYPISIRKRNEWKKQNLSPRAATDQSDWKLVFVHFFLFYFHSSYHDHDHERTRLGQMTIIIINSITHTNTHIAVTRRRMFSIGWQTTAVVYTLNICVHSLIWCNHVQCKQCKCLSAKHNSHIYSTQTREMYRKVDNRRMHLVPMMSMTIIIIYCCAAHAQFLQHFIMEIENADEGKTGIIQRIRWILYSSDWMPKTAYRTRYDLELESEYIPIIRCNTWILIRLHCIDRKDSREKRILSNSMEINFNLKSTTFSTIHHHTTQHPTHYTRTDYTYNVSECPFWLAPLSLLIPQRTSTNVLIPFRTLKL